MKYNWYIAAIVILAIALIVSLSKCGKEEPTKLNPSSLIDSIRTENRILQELSESIMQEKMSDSIRYLEEIAHYKSLKRKAKIIYIETRVGGSITYTDTTTCFDDTQIDSLNIISIERDYCYADRVHISDLYNIKSVQYNNLDTALKKSIEYTGSLEKTHGKLLSSHRKLLKKNNKLKKVTIVATIVALVEGVILAVKN